jgi:hypothetical protein
LGMWAACLHVPRMSSFALDRGGGSDRTNSEQM